MRTIDRRVSKIDGAIKLLFKFHDGAPAESVVLFNKGRATACLSSQSGCPCACAFCATGARNEDSHNQRTPSYCLPTDL